MMSDPFSTNDRKRFSLTHVEILEGLLQVPGFLLNQALHLCSVPIHFLAAAIMLWLRG